MKLFQYIKTKQDLTKKSWVKVDNVNAYKWFGLSSSTKWRAIKKLEQDKLIEVKRKYGASPQIKIICPRKKIN
jgi:CTP-dependent riboflavin kinase